MRLWQVFIRRSITQIGSRGTGDLNFVGVLSDVVALYLVMAALHYLLTNTIQDGSHGTARSLRQGLKLC